MHLLRASQIQFPKHLGPLLLIATVCVSSFGCFGNSNLPGETGTVSGVLRVDGKPAPKETVVVFIHSDSGIIGTGVVDSDGAFDLQMRGDRYVLVGNYVISITPPGNANEEVGQLTMETAPKSWKAIPQKYWSQETSGLTYEVKPGENEPDLKLTTD